MPKVSVRSLRSLASKCNPSILTSAITESADYIEELEREVERLKKDKEFYAKIATADSKKKPNFTLSNRTDR